MKTPDDFIDEIVNWWNVTEKLTFYWSFCDIYATKFNDAAYQWRFKSKS